MYLTKKLRERYLGRGIEGVQVTVNEYLDRWLDTAAKPRCGYGDPADYGPPHFRHRRLQRRSGTPRVRVQ
jgi:hypothetical protein